MILEAEMSQVLQSANGRPRRADGVIQPKFKVLRTSTVNGVNSSLKAGMCETQEKVPAFVVCIWKQEKEACPSSGSQAGEIPQHFVLVKSSSAWMRSICIREGALALLSHVNLIQKHPHRHTWNDIQPNVWAPHGKVDTTNESSQPDMLLLLVQGSLWEPLL